MININFKNTIYRILNSKDNLSRITKRTMFTTRNVANKAINMNFIRQVNPAGTLGNHTNTVVTNPLNLKSIQRSIPGQGYDSGRYHKDTRTATGRNLLQHEEVHTNIIDRETNKNVAIFSSCKKSGFYFISEKNIKKDTLPNSKPKEQWATPFKTPRCHDEDIFVKDKEATDFANQHKEKIDTMLYKANTHNKVPIKRVHKESSELYHENDQQIFDSTGHEIEYH